MKQIKFEVWYHNLKFTKEYDLVIYLYLGDFISLEALNLNRTMTIPRYQDQCYSALLDSIY